MKTSTMVVPTIFCSCRVSSRSMKRYRFGKLCETSRKIRDTARSRRAASRPAFPISSPTPRIRRDCHDWNQDQDFFRYTAGRFLFEEKNQMACRYVKFDMNELVHIAASSVASRSCVAICKLPEGQYNKAFLLTMDDGKRVVAKVPNPNAGRPHYTTASDVATMDYVSIISCYNIKALTLSSMSSRFGQFSSSQYQRCTHGIREPQIIQSGQNSL